MTVETLDPQVDTTKSVETAPLIGIIYPPPEVRNIVDKTAGFVARNGPDFEGRIRQNEVSNSKFNFLNPKDPYNAYYKHKVEEFKEGRGQEPVTTTSASGAVQSNISSAQEALVSQLIPEPAIPKEPPPEYEFLVEPPTIAAFDLDVVKLTAQFVARNGRQFLTNLMNKEFRNYQFDFLRPQHSHFSYFTKLVEQYTKVLIPKKDTVKKLRVEVDSGYTAVLDKVKHRVEWDRFVQRVREREEEKEEKERVAYAQINWHDFVIVETVDYRPLETGVFPAPTTAAEVGARVLKEERMHRGEKVHVLHLSGEEDNTEDMDEESDSGHVSDRELPDADSGDEMKSKLSENNRHDTRRNAYMEKAPVSLSSTSFSSSNPPLSSSDSSPFALPPPFPLLPDKVVVRRDYDPKARVVTNQEPSNDKFLISPITGEKIPADKVAEHMRYGMLDPSWRATREFQINEKQQEDEVIAAGSSISSHLSSLAERRTDIFGVEETVIGKKIGEKHDSKSALQWDGHAGSMTSIQKKAQSSVTVEDKIEAARIEIQKGMEKERIGPQSVKNDGVPPPDGANPPPPPPPPSMPPHPPPSMPPHPPPSMPQHPPPSIPQHPPPSMPQHPTPSSVPAPPVNQVSMSAPPPAPLPSSLPSSLPTPPSTSLPVFTPASAQTPVPTSVVTTVVSAPSVTSIPPAIMNVRPVMMQQMTRPLMQILVPGGPPSATMLMGMPSAPAPNPGWAPMMRPEMQSMPQGPPVKKARTEDQLVPEAEFLQRWGNGSVSFHLAIPNDPTKPEWNLQGQTLKVVIPLSDPVATIKGRIHNMLGVPTVKQKLQYEGLFIKDSNSLAFYNIIPDSVVHLHLKERGGRKK